MAIRILLSLTQAALFWFPATTLAQVAINERLAEGQPPMVIAHRSATMRGFPENSLAWIGYGIERGVDMVHINPPVTADGHYVLMHDQTLNRLTNVETVYPDGPPGGPTREQRGGHDHVRDYTLEEIGKLRIAQSGDGDVHALPTLGDALEAVDGRVLVLLGLKA